MENEKLNPYVNVYRHVCNVRMRKSLKEHDDTFQLHSQVGCPIPNINVKSGTLTICSYNGLFTVSVHMCDMINLELDNQPENLSIWKTSGRGQKMETKEKEAHCLTSNHIPG